MAAQTPQTPQKNKVWQELAPYMNIGTELAGTVGVFGIVGWFADKYFGTTPWSFVVMLVLGVMIGMTKMIQSVLKSSKPRTPKPQVKP
ncbi:MAG: AtpZ/AtpI family protein [Candidatus Kapaibacterium sp.]|nr:MAG: AtpZ/AtpI family protein [Candidatus Kapabacteria bacterium]